MKSLAVLALCLAASLARAQPDSCIQAATDRRAFNECAQREILPLEAKVVHLLSSLRTKYKGNRSLLESLQSSEDAWNTYRNGHCGVEAAARGGASDIEVQRAFAVCAKRTLELRVRELESL